ncbi:hypothetical protein Tco_0377610 [Tanacetum coccineum]
MPVRLGADEGTWLSHPGCSRVPSYMHSEESKISWNSSMMNGFRNMMNKMLTNKDDDGSSMSDDFTTNSTTDQATSTDHSTTSLHSVEYTMTATDSSLSVSTIKLPMSQNGFSRYPNTEGFTKGYDSSTSSLRQLENFMEQVLSLLRMQIKFPKISTSASVENKLHHDSLLAISIKLPQTGSWTWNRCDEYDLDENELTIMWQVSHEMSQMNEYSFTEKKVLGILLENAESREIKITREGMHGILETRISESDTEAQMTGNKAYLAEFARLDNRWSVAFGGSICDINWSIRKLTNMQVQTTLLMAGDSAQKEDEIWVKTALFSTACPHEGLSLSDPTNPEEDDSEIPPLEDIYQNSTDGIFTTSSYDDEGAVANFINLETVHVLVLGFGHSKSSHLSAVQEKFLGDSFLEAMQRADHVATSTTEARISLHAASYLWVADLSNQGSFDVKQVQFHLVVMRMME